MKGDNEVNIVMSNKRKLVKETGQSTLSEFVFTRRRVAKTEVQNSGRHPVLKNVSPNEST